MQIEVRASWEGDAYQDERMASGAAMRRYRQNAAYGTAGAVYERSDFRHMSVTGRRMEYESVNRMWKR